MNVTWTVRNIIILLKAYIYPGPHLPAIMSNTLDAHNISLPLQYIGVRFRRFTYVLQQPNPPSNWFENVMTEIVRSPDSHGNQFIYYTFSAFLSDCSLHAVPMV